MVTGIGITDKTCYYSNIQLGIIFETKWVVQNLELMSKPKLVCKPKIQKDNNDIMLFLKVFYRQIN